MTNLLRTSEFWMAVIVALGQTGSVLGFWSQEDWSLILYPALTYIVGRLISKAAKTAPPPTQP